MAEILIARLTDQYLVYPVGPAVFSSLVADTLGVAATPADGFEAMHAAVMQEFPVDEGQGPHLDQQVAAADFQAGTIRASQVVPLGHDIDAFNSTIEPTSTGLNKVLATKPEGVNTAAIIPPGECPKGQKYNPLWFMFGWKGPCRVPKS